MSETLPSDACKCSADTGRRLREHYSGNRACGPGGGSWAEQRAELRAKAEQQGAAARRRTERGAADGSLLWRITDLCDNRVSRARARAQHIGKRCPQEGRKHRHTDTPTDPTKGRAVC